MDKLQADKLTEIRERATTEAIARSSHKEYSIYDLLLDDISYLLQLVETQAKALDEAEGMSKRWEKAFVNADKQYLKMEKKAAELGRKLEALTQV